LLQVASDPTVTRPQRPESLGRAGAPSADSGSFNTLLDQPEAPNPPPARTDRSTPSDPTKRTRTDDGSKSDTPPSRDTAVSADAPTTQPKTKKAAATPAKQQAEAKDGQPSDTAPVAGDAAAATDASAVTVDLAVIAKGAKPDAAAKGDAKAVETGTTTDEKKTEDKKETGDAKKTGDDSAAADATSADAKSPDVTAAAIVAVAVATPVPTDITAKASPDSATSPVGDATVPSIAPEKAPAVPADAAPPELPADAAVPPAAADAGDAKPAKSANTDGAKLDAIVEAVAADVAPKALKTAGAAEQTETKFATRPERKADTANKPNVQSDAKTTEARPDADRPQGAPVDPDAKVPAAPHQHAQAADHAANPGSAPADAPSDVAAAPTDNAPASTAGTPAPSINLAAPTPSLSAPAVALRVDNAADNPVPVAGLAVEIVARAQDGAKRFDIRLDPPELGRIDVRLDVDTNGKVTSRLTVERADTLDLLRRDAPQLERALQHAGLNTEGGLQFSLRDQNFTQRDQTPRDVTPTHLIVPDDDAVAAEAARRGYGRLIGLGSGVDIRV
jgi:chemotaxis protein MotD